jgi:hypothetical protein
MLWTVFLYLKFYETTLTRIKLSLNSVVLSVIWTQHAIFSSNAMGLFQSIWLSGT